MHSIIHATQQVLALSNGRLETFELPSAGSKVSGHAITWGDATIPLTPAYWAAQAWMWTLDAPEHFRLGGDLQEELLACMLGGYGIPAEVGLAAYRRLRPQMHACPAAISDMQWLTAQLEIPLAINGRMVRYRFARQKAKFISAAFNQLPLIDRSLDDRPLRDDLTKLRGVGPKTASWVVRNLRRSNEVAILDVHILRAGRFMGIFDPRLTVERNYPELEAAYLRFARAIEAPASILDSVMWMTMRGIPSDFLRPSKSHARSRVRTDQMRLAV